MQKSKDKFFLKKIRMTRGAREHTWVLIWKIYNQKKINKLNSKLRVTNYREVTI